MTKLADGTSLFLILLPKKIESKIKKETNWPDEFSVVADIGPSLF